MAYDFTDPISGHMVTLHVAPTLGVKHGDCPQRADVSVELDAFYCSFCGWNGRISGAWVMDLLRRNQ